MKIEMHVGTTKMINMEVDDKVIVESEIDIVAECVTAMDLECRSELSRQFLADWLTRNPTKLDLLRQSFMTPEVRDLIITDFSAEFLQWISQTHNVDIIVKKFS